MLAPGWSGAMLFSAAASSSTRCALVSGSEAWVIRWATGPQGSAGVATDTEGIQKAIEKAGFYHASRVLYPASELNGVDIERPACAAGGAVGELGAPGAQK